MNKDVQWFAYFGLQEGFLNQRICRVIYRKWGEDTDLLTLGEYVLDERFTDDYELVQRLVDQAYDRAIKGESPPEHPFKDLRKKSANTKGFFLKRDPLSDTATPQQVAVQSQQDAVAVQSQQDAATTRHEATSTQQDTTLPQENTTLPQQDTTLPQQDTATPQQIAIQSQQVAQQPIDPDSPVVDHETACHSEQMASFSLDVPQSWPDFASLAALSDDAIRQVVVQLLIEGQRYAASDVHISSGSRPFIRQYRKIHYISDTVLTEQDAFRLNTALLSEAQRDSFERQQDFDYALALDASNRFRVNLMIQKMGAAGTYRIIPNKILTLEELGFNNADIIKKLLTYHNGLVLVTGPVGSGKTATLAALIHELNQTRQDHIITVEAPIEVVQLSQHCQITQREVGPQTATFHSALKGALRQDPDIIVIGEMRDLETVEMAIRASETGHLVIATMHTQDATTTLNRLLDVFPAAQQTQIRAMVSESLKGIICQRLLPNLTGGISLACELLLNNTAVANMIRESKNEGLVNAIETGLQEGMALMDKSIMKLYFDQVISQDVAVANMTNRVFINQVKPSSPASANGADSTATTKANKKKKFGKTNT